MRSADDRDAIPFVTNWGHYLPPRNVRTPPQTDTVRCTLHKHLLNVDV